MLLRKQCCVVGILSWADSALLLLFAKPEVVDDLPKVVVAGIYAR